MQVHQNIPVTSRVVDPGSCGSQRLYDGGNTTTPDRYTPVLHIVTAATDLQKHQMSNFLRTASAYGLQVTVLSPTAPMGHPVGGRFGIKMQLTANFVNMLHEQDFVMVVDAYDVAFAGSAHDIISGFKQAVEGRDIVLFGAETGLWPDESLGPLFPPAPSKFRYL